MLGLKNITPTFKIWILIILLAVLWGIFIFFEKHSTPGWDTLDQLGIGTVTTIVFDASGTAWLGSNRGIKLYDGETFSDFSPEISGHPINTIVFDDIGNIWFGSWGLLVYDGENFHTYDIDNSNLTKNSVLGIVIDREGKFWIATGGGYNIIDGDTWTSYTKDNSGNDLEESGIPAIAIDPKGRVWLGSSFGIDVYDGKDVISYNSQNSGLIDAIVSEIAFDIEGRAWIGTHAGLNVFDGNTWTTYTYFDSDLVTNLVTHLVIEHTGRVWVGTYKGINVIDGGTWTTFTKDNSGLLYNQVRALAVDPSGRVWVSSAGDGQNAVSLAPTGDDLNNPSIAPDTSIKIRYNFFSRGSIWLTTIALIVLYLAIILDVKVALIGVFGWLLSLPFMVRVGNHQVYFNGLYGVFYIITNFGAIGSLIGAFFAKDSDQKAKRISTAFWSGIGLGTLLVICYVLAIANLAQ